MGTKGKVLGGVAAAAAAVGAGVVVARRRDGTTSLYRVRPVADGWAVSKDGGNQASSTHRTKKEALSAGRQLAKSNAPSTLILHYADDREQKRVTYEVD